MHYAYPSFQPKDNVPSENSIKKEITTGEITKANNSTHAFRFFFHLRIEKDTKEKITAFARAHIDKRKP